MPPTEVDEKRELARAYWAGKPANCPRHGVPMKGIFIESGYYDQLVLDCPRGETVTIRQRPKQTEFNAHQLEGFVVFLQRGDNVLCYRCQAVLQVSTTEDRESGVASYVFTCTRCFSWGRWSGKPELASVVGVTDRIA